MMASELSIFAGQTLVAGGSNPSRRTTELPPVLPVQSGFFVYLVILS